MKKLIVLLVLIIVVFSLYAKQNEQLLTVVFTNDSHGMAWNFDEPGNPGVGGLAAQKTLVDRIRAEVKGKGGNILILSGGDITLGDPRSNICNNLPYIKGMNLIGYDAMVIGNHEFDFGLKAFHKMKEIASFPFLSANIYEDSGTKAVAEEYIEKKFDNGLKVGILGVTTRETEQITGSGLEGKLIMTDPIQEAKTKVPMLKKRNDIVIVLSHLGFYDTDKSFDGYYGDNYLAKTVPGIDLIVGGHTQRHLAAPVRIGDTYIVQTGGYGKWVGRFDFYIKGKKIVKTNFKLYPINLKKKVIKNRKISYEFLEKKIPENKTMLKMLDGFKCTFSNKKIGNLPKNLTGKREVVRFRESELGDIIADIMKERVNADIAFFNSGSIRQGLKKGKITKRMVYNVFPFGDTLYVGTMKGHQLQEVLDYFAEKGQGAGGFLQVSGLSMKIYKGAALEIKINGKKLDKKKKYRFAINSFIANGGDGYEILRKIPTKKDTGYNLPAIIVEYIKKHNTLPKVKKGRITIVK